MAQAVTIASLGAQGDGISEDGIYVPFALPGEQARIDRLGDRGRLLELIGTSPARTDPLCPHFTECGGCTMQHASDRLVAEWKREIIRQALSARGIEGVEIRPIYTSPPASRQRISVAARRTKKTVQIGFHAAGSDRIVPISACVVAAPDLIDALPSLAELIPLA
ncbi:MAG: hypothetical protein AAF568_05525, partial [Pseudomonadota bacterium]